MKKIVLVFIMFGLCVSFYFVVSNRKPEMSLGSKKIDIQSELEKYNNIINKNYPETPKELIELNNKLMSYLYSKDMQEKYADFYVETIRNLYDKELLVLNFKEDQVNFVLIELEQNAEKNIRLLGSEIEEVTVLDDEAMVKVTHYLNTNDITRVYKLIRATGEWKIVSWEDLKQNSTKSEE